MCCVARIELGADPTEVSVGRRFVGAALRRWSLESHRSDAELLTSELVSNAVTHGAPPVRISVTVAESVVEVGVSDRSSLVPQRRAEDWSAEGGRGILLVERIAQEWGVVFAADGKQVWFRLPADKWPHREACPCSSTGAGPDSHLLGSGRYAYHGPGPWDL